MTDKTQHAFITAISTTDEAFETIAAASSKFSEAGFEFDDKNKINLTERVGAFLGEKYTTLGINSDVAEKVLLLNTVTVPAAVADALHTAAFAKYSEGYDKENQSKTYAAEAVNGVVHTNASVTYSGDSGFAKTYGARIQSGAIVAKSKDLHSKMETMMKEMLETKK